MQTLDNKIMADSWLRTRLTTKKVIQTNNNIGPGLLPFTKCDFLQVFKIVLNVDR